MTWLSRLSGEAIVTYHKSDGVSLYARLGPPTRVSVERQASNSFSLCLTEQKKLYPQPIFNHTWACAGPHFATLRWTWPLLLAGHCRPRAPLAGSSGRNSVLLFMRIRVVTWADLMPCRPPSIVLPSCPYQEHAKNSDGFEPLAPGTLHGIPGN